MPAHHDAVGGERFPRPYIQQHARQQCLAGNVAQGLGFDLPLDNAGGTRRNGVQRLGRVDGHALTALLQKTPHEQGKDQERQSVEVDRTGIGDRIHGAAYESGGERDRDRQVHVQRARAQRRPGAGEEHATRPEERRHGDRTTHPPEEPREAGVHGIQFASVERQGREHDVDRDGTGDADAHEHRPIFALPHVGPRHPAKRMRRIAEGVERLRNPRQRHGGHVPLDHRQGAPYIELGPQHAGHDQRHALHQPDTRRAVDALEIELGARQAVGHRRDVQVGEGRMIELVVAAPRGPHGRFATFGEAVIRVEAVCVEDAEGRVAAAAAKLPVGVFVPQSFGHRQAAMCAQRIGSDGGRHGGGRHGMPPM